MTGNGEVMKRRIREGTGQFPMDCPMADSRLQIHYRYALLSCITPFKGSQFEPSECSNVLNHLNVLLPL